MHTTASSLQAASVPDELARRDLRTEFVEAYGARVFLVLSVVGALVLLPFSINGFVQGAPVQASTTLLIAGFLIANAVFLARGHAAPIPPAAIFAPALLGLGLAMYRQGLVGMFWCYPAILLFHFVLPRRTANIFNGCIVLLAVPMAWLHLGPEITARVGVTLALTLLFTNIFSYVADAQRRKEMEQRQRLDLVVRGTNAGTLEWEPEGAASFSPRLRQMLGRSYEDDTGAWDFFSFVHPDDRERVQAQVARLMREHTAPHAVRHQPADEYRLLTPQGDITWVHTEGIAVSDRRGRTARYVCTFMDITERVRAQEALLRSHERVQQQAAQLERRNTELREAIRMREEVERIARHDLRTPLASIAYVPRLLRQGRNLDAREEELLAIVERGALRVLSMVNLSLDLYRMEEGSYTVRPAAVDLAEVARNVVQEVRAHADAKRVRLTVDLPAAGSLHVRGEELLCYSIAANLVKNAVEAAPEGSTVAVALQHGSLRGDEGRMLRIHNLGAVPAPIRARFFEKYTTHGKDQGTGLGAYSAWLMARVQGGELQMETDDEAGTTLTLWLPAAHVTSMAPGAPARDGEAVPPLALLLVDDDPYTVSVLKNLLPVPLPVEVVGNGRAALEHVARQRPDVIFLDLQMPVMGGLEAIGRIRQLQRERDQMPSVIVAFSSCDDEPTRRKCRQAGFDHYLVKPASREELLEVLRMEPAFAASTLAHA
ncbi:hybrid sensor histidine kinase/response regulator [Ramlibacter albus]|uniref:histidine kinase n=1 Tax=Ramlibacter albus TaxID=2079448 RepID=A0A923M9C7_9BURK|nr:hybrid sensor histidine kinase/response regulator [Ramlibacter albus]MBC5766410.1 response regulator [Ramlibacter albus]